MFTPILRNYGESTVIPIALFDTSGTMVKGTSVLVAGDVTISIDGASAVNTLTIPIDRGQYFELTLSASELTGKKMFVLFRDLTSPADWLDDYITIETYGHASAQHPYIGLSAANVNLTKINNSTSAVDNFYNSLSTITIGTVVVSAISPTVNQFQALDVIYSNDDRIKNKSIYWISGDRVKEFNKITAYNSTNRLLTVSTMTGNISAGDRFLII